MTTGRKRYELESELQAKLPMESSDLTVVVTGSGTGWIANFQPSGRRVSMNERRALINAALKLRSLHHLRGG